MDLFMALFHEINAHVWAIVVKMEVTVLVALVVLDSMAAVESTKVVAKENNEKALVRSAKAKDVVLV